ncbi:hypothetical protein V5O48_005376 [Marasmius crinis-equi]|uniref:CxC2-like cysteine cluster KDZ transposase-associated domain-containing protein n=1 Tax=Marasmius crinis-equi TaxID=585013 RepID=A0ABR3FMJ6_9AGAR
MHNKRKPSYSTSTKTKRQRLKTGIAFFDRVEDVSGQEPVWENDGRDKQMPGAFPVLDGMDMGLGGIERLETKKVVEDIKLEPESDASLPPMAFGEGQQTEEDGALPKPPKARRTVRSRYPNIEWKERYRAAFLDEIVRHKGRGDYRKQRRCSDCKIGVSDDVDAKNADEQVDGVRQDDEKDGSLPPTIRCRECFHQDLLCAECCVRRHWDNPYHHVEEWAGELFERTSLADLGLIIQLNHVSGTCSNPVKCYQHLVVIHTNGIHRVNFQFCGCAKAIPQHLQLLRRNLYPTNIKKGRISTVITFQYLEYLQIHTLTTKGSIHDFYRAVERLSDNTGLKRPKPRYRQLLRGIRQWRHLKLLLRGGKGQAAISTLEEEPDGALILKCPSCPHPGINLPQNWQVEARGPLGFLYRLCLCLDANFRLKEQAVSSHSRDPALCDGLGYFVRRAPFEKWLEENKKVEDSEDEASDISNCVPFAALTKQTSKFSKGLRYTGVAGVVCGRSDMIVKVANLNKGERFSIIDYVLGMAMGLWSTLLWLLLCYDIACQYYRNFDRRKARWPSHISLSSALNIVVAIGKLHHPGHNSDKHEEFDLNLRPGAGQTDGESCERFWANHNGLSNASKTMGPGARQDMMESQFDFHNWEKYKAMGQHLQRRLKNATKDEQDLREDHDDLTENLPKDMVARWEVEVTAWEEAGWKKEKVMNPYAIANEWQAEAMRELALEDEERLKRGEVRFHETSQAAFVAMCLDLRDKQEKLKALVEERARDPTVRQEGKLVDQRNAVRRQILNLEEVRAVYMPGLAKYLREVGGGEDTDEQKAEDITVWLPSSIPRECRKRVCVSGILEVETRLQKGRAYDALDGLRHSLRVKARMMLFKNSNMRGQRDSGRANETITQVATRVNGFAQRYRRSREAYYSLIGMDNGGEELPKLEVSDVRNYRDPATVHVGPGRRGTNELWEEGEKKDEGQRAEIITGGHLIPLDRREWEHRSVHGTGETRKTLSWIWTHRGHKINLEDGVDDSELLRAEWCRSRARKMRAEEEVMLVREEMRRTLQYLEWAAQQWESRKDSGEVVKRALKEGRAAFAVEQAAIQRGLRDKFARMWDNGADVKKEEDNDDIEEPEGEEEEADGLEEEGALDEDDEYDVEGM